MTLPLKNLVRLVLATTFILLLPLVAMQFTPEVAWSPADFMVAGTLLFGTGLAYELVVRKGGNRAYRVAVGVGLGAGLLLVWTNLAVGLIGTEHNPANLLYGGVLVVGIIGALLARFRPQGMARALFAAALAQAVVPLIALLIQHPRVTDTEDVQGLLGVLGVNAFFVVLWCRSAWLFRRASTTNGQ